MTSRSLAHEHAVTSGAEQQRKSDMNPEEQAHDDETCEWYP